MCVYRGSGPLLVFLVVMVSAVDEVLLFMSRQLCPAQHLHSQPVVNHLYTSLTVCQAHLGCTLQEHTERVIIFISFIKSVLLYLFIHYPSSASVSTELLSLSDPPVVPPEPEVPASRQTAAERTPPGRLQGQECRSLR